MEVGAVWFDPWCGKCRIILRDRKGLEVPIVVDRTGHFGVSAEDFSERLIGLTVADRQMELFEDGRKEGR